MQGNRTRHRQLRWQIGGGHKAFDRPTHGSELRRRREQPSHYRDQVPAATFNPDNAWQGLNEAGKQYNAEVSTRPRGESSGLDFEKGKAASRKGHN
jgi:hypothetical protein